VRLAVVCPHPVGCAPSQRLKYEQYFASWRKNGFDVDVFPFWDEEAWKILYMPGKRAAKASALRRAFQRRRRQEKAWLSADVVYVHLGIAPVGPPIFERRLIRSGVPFVYDLDDLVHLPHGSSANRFMRRLRRPDRVTELMGAAAHVVVCTEHLASFAEGFNERVTDISSTIDTEVYAPRPHRAQRPLVIGWSGSHSTSPYLHELDGVLSRLAAREDIQLKVIGDPSFKMPGVDVDANAWNSVGEVAALSEIDIGVYPLPDEEWVLGKSGLKALQYMALEIPTVAERLGSNEQIIEDGVTGFLVHGEDEWLSRLTELIRDPELRRRMGMAGRRTVVERYSVEANESAYLEVLTTVAGGR
jgi:glycosyltransferase involved in cell wall biosynthesis